jgi:transposase InsO family protein
MQHVDALSRNPQGSNAREVEDMVGVNVVVVEEADWFLTMQLQDPRSQELVRALSAGEADRNVKATFRVKGNRLYRITTNGDRLYVPSMAKFNLVRRHHDDIGHPGFRRCLELVKQTYWFPKMSRFVRKYVSACLRCAYMAGNYGPGEGRIHLWEKRPIPFDTVHIDHVGPFVRSNKGYAYLLVLVDGFTKFVLVKATKSLRSTETISRLRELFGEFGYPRRIISDRGLAFTSQAFQEFMVEKGIRHVQNAIATPRANGQVERANRTIIEALGKSADAESRWDEHIGEVVWGINNTVNDTTKFSPHQLMFGRANGVFADLDGEMLASAAGEVEGGQLSSGGAVGVDDSFHTKEQHQGDDLACIAAAMRDQRRNEWQAASDNINRANRRVCARLARRRKKAPRYKVKDLVLWRNASAYKADSGANRKLANKYDGPFRIAKALPHDRYIIETVPGVRGYKRFTATVAVDALRRYPSGVQGDSDSDSEGTDRRDLIDLLES